MNNLKRLLSSIIFAALLAAMIPASVMAADEEFEGIEEAQEAGIPGDSINLGDGLWAYITRNGDEVIFSTYVDYGTPVLPKDFMQGHDKTKVRSIYVNPGSLMIRLPEDSSYLFEGFTNLESIKLGGFDTSLVKNMRGMFSNCRRLTKLDLSGFNTAKTTDMSEMFYNCHDLEEINFSGFNTSQVTTMSYMFYNCFNLKQLNLGGFDTSRVNYMNSMFLNCDSLEKLDLYSFNTTNVISMSSMFLGCQVLKNLNVRSFNTSNVRNIDFMFGYLPRINELDLQSFDLSSVSKMYEPDAPRGSFCMPDLLTLKTPKNCKVYMEFFQPMYDIDGNKYVSMPNKPYSMYLYNSKILASGGFKDVRDKNAWYYVPVYWAVGRGYTSGMGEGTFQPNANLTRAQAVAFLYKLRGSPDVSYLPEVNFSDVPKSAWYYTAVRWAVGHGITSGYGSGTFQPNKNCTRAMIVTFLMNYSKVSVQYKKPTKSSNFKDVPEDAWYIDAVDWAVENGITSGYGEGTFRPNAVCTRAMMVAFIKSLSELPLQN